MVIFPPIFQVGCFNAFSAVIPTSSSLDLPRKGPPEAVMSILSRLEAFSPLRHCHIAQCSLSTGRSATPFSLTSGMITSPPDTRVSLFARAMSLPAKIALNVGRSPATPTIAPTTVSHESRVAIEMTPSSPLMTSVLIPAVLILDLNSSAFTGSATETASGENSSICL